MADNLTPTTSMEDLAKYHHQNLCLPTKAVVLQSIAIRQLKSFPGLTYKPISKYLPPSTATAQGVYGKNTAGGAIYKDLLNEGGF